MSFPVRARRSLTLADRRTAGADLVGVFLTAQGLGRPALGSAGLRTSDLLRPVSAIGGAVMSRPLLPLSMLTATLVSNAPRGARFPWSPLCHGNGLS